MSDPTQQAQTASQSTQPPAPAPTPQPQIQQLSQQVQQQQIHVQQQTPHQVTRVTSVQSSMPTVLAPAPAPTPQPTLTANTLRSSTTPMPQLQVIGPAVQGQPYLQQFPSYTAQPFVFNNLATAMQMTQNFNQLSQLGILQQQQQQQQGRAGTANPTNDTILSPTSQIQNHGTLTNSGNLIQSSVQGMIPAGTSNSNVKTQGNTSKTQSQTIASIVGKQQTVLPAQQTQQPQPVVLGQIGVAGANTGTFVAQPGSNSQIRINSPQVVNQSGQIITSQPVQNLLANPALMQAMATIQLQQGIPLASGQQIINQGQGQMSAFLAGQNLFIRTANPIAPQPIVTNMQAAAFTSIKPQHQAQHTGKNQASGKVVLPSTSRSSITAKIQPSISGNSTNNQNKISVPALTKTPKARPKPVSKSTPTVATSSPSTPSLAKTPVSTVVVSATTTTTSTADAVTAPTATPPVVVSHAYSSILPVVSVLSTPQANETGVSSIKDSPSVSSTVATTPTVQTESRNQAEQSNSVQDKENEESKHSSPKIDEKVKTSVLPPTKTTGSALVDDVFIEDKPIIDTTPITVASTNMKAAMAAAGLTTSIPDTKPVLGLGNISAVAEKRKAIVKPQILTHVIDGFVIREGSVPFPVQQSCLLQEFIPPKIEEKLEKESEEEVVSYDDEPSAPYSHLDAVSPQSLSHTEDQDTNKHEDDPLKTLKCETCQKQGPASTFSSQRFCSITCSRRYNATHPRGHAIFKTKGGLGHKRKRTDRKDWNAEEVESNEKSSSHDGEHDDHAVAAEISSSNSVQETSSSAASPLTTPAVDFYMDVDASVPHTDIGKWTVKEVYDFIQSLPGCCEYAEEFRSQEIDGQALLLLKEDHLMQAMNLKLGPALKICSKITSMRAQPSQT